MAVISALVAFLMLDPPENKPETVLAPNPQGGLLDQCFAERDALIIASELGASSRSPSCMSFVVGHAIDCLGNPASILKTYYVGHNTVSS